MQIKLRGLILIILQKRSNQRKQTVQLVINNQMGIDISWHVLAKKSFLPSKLASLPRPCFDDDLKAEDGATPIPPLSNHPYIRLNNHPIVLSKC